MSEKLFEVSSYREGFYRPNGSFSSDPLFNEGTILKWEEVNSLQLQSKGWGVGQALFFRNRPLIFGRNAEKVDVVIDRDPSVTGEISNEMHVSGVHFALVPILSTGSNSLTGLVIKDLGSTNGTYVYEGSSEPTKLIANLSHFLMSGDLVTFCDNPKPEGYHPATLGFRVCSDDKKGLLLVKFNLKNRRDFLDIILNH